MDSAVPSCGLKPPDPSADSRTCHPSSIYPRACLHPAPLGALLVSQVPSSPSCSSWSPGPVHLRYVGAGTGHTLPPRLVPRLPPSTPKMGRGLPPRGLGRQVLPSEPPSCPCLVALPVTPGPGLPRPLCLSPAQFPSVQLALQTSFSVDCLAQKYSVFPPLLEGESSLLADKATKGSRVSRRFCYSHIHYSSSLPKWLQCPSRSRDLATGSPALGSPP